MAKNLTFLIVTAISIIFCSVCQAESIVEKQSVWIATVHDTINPMVAEYLNDLIDEAEKNGVYAVILELDTPGGLVDSTRAIVRKFMNSKIPIITYVSPSGARAASAGMFITIASHVAVMAPATNIGAAHPVSMGPGGPINQDEKEESQRDKRSIEVNLERTSDSSVMEDKIMNDMLAWSKTIAENRGRNVQWVMNAVKDSISSTETEALEQGVIDFVATDMNHLIEQLHGKMIKINGNELILDTEDVELFEKEMTWRQEFLSILINPTLAIYLLALGGLGLYFELSHPGFIVPGVIGAICFILGLFAMHTLPINTAGLILILLSFIFFVIEVKMPSYGILTIGGIVSFLLGSTMLVDAEVSGMQVSIFSVIPLALAVAAVTVFLVSLVVKSHSSKVTTGETGLVGEKGRVTRTLNPDGKIFLHGEIWNARSDDGSEILENTMIIVVKSEGLVLTVMPLKNNNKEEL